MTDSFVITGDIPAMWLRDSTNQVLPYIPFANQDAGLQELVCGLIRRQARQVSTNRYANAFNMDPSPAGHHTDTVTTQPQVCWGQSGYVYENKYELDSLVNVLQLSNQYYNSTKDMSCFQGDPTWLSAVTDILETLRVQQVGTDESFTDPPYTFQRLTEVWTDTLMNRGHGAPGRRTGMSKTYFRPSDDASTFPFNVAANAFAVVQLRRLGEPGAVLAQLNHTLAREARALADEIDAGIHAHGIVHPAGGRPYFAYEVDGFGSCYFMDDANIPSLLSLPYLGYVSKDDPVYLETRRRLLSTEKNPWYFEGTAGKGIGGPHQGTGMIWPMAVIMQALTSRDESEISACLEMLESTHADMFYMHESFNKDDQFHFTRPWFSWANSLFGELMLTLAHERPHLIFSS
eukprot:TRINITY_DN19224_c0_g2_i4.p1 TRINITY_DN19224_c0_g2~~TRINITY_DN19224_c0_g2_i4.p1  ORF type:complete len:403 (-),score=42.12 TRINITY_DN19224_c0_g2_i4:11-1219(-)